jgi:para-aminobenzoate synthetase/4-amino-4-deoxychorismate lyase
VRPPFVILDFPAAPSRPGTGALLFEQPRFVLEARSLAEVEPLMRALDEHAARGFHAVGFVSYEAGPAFDPAVAAHPPGAVPLAWFGVFDAPRGVATLPAHRTPSAEWRHRADGGDYAKAVATIRDAIGRGDVYQVNYTLQLDVDVHGDAAALYTRLLAAQGPGYGARIHTGRHEVLSASPELFIERHGEVVETKPISGPLRSPPPKKSAPKT